MVITPKENFVILEFYDHVPMNINCKKLINSEQPWFSENWTTRMYTLTKSKILWKGCLWYYWVASRIFFWNFLESTDLKISNWRFLPTESADLLHIVGLNIEILIHFEAEQRKNECFDLMACNNKTLLYF